MTGDLRIEPAVRDDARGIAQVHVDGWRAAYATIVSPALLERLSVDKRETMWTEIIARAESEILVARHGDGLAGWINFGRSRDEGAGPAEGEIWAFYVAPALWSTGAGRALWLAAHDRLRSRGFATCCLWVFPENARAIRFYERAGFVRDPAPPKSFELAGETLHEIRFARRLSPE